MASIELTPEFKKALHFLNDSVTHCFITGKAGTGKSTLLRYFVSQTKIKVAVLAPTGIAAINVGGQTIHSFFGFKPNITWEIAKKGGQKASRQNNDTNLYQHVEALVVDEVSMLRADLLDCMDVFLKYARLNLKNPFGGVKMIFVGDLYQLPPVVTSQEKEIFSSLMYDGPYFFNSQIMKAFKLEVVELEKVFRQKDSEFIRLLNAIRNGTIAPEDLRLLNERVGKKPFSKDLTVLLTPTNKRAGYHNLEKLSQLQSKQKIYRAEVEGNVDEKMNPTDQVLELKKGAQVMLLNNDSMRRWVNGTMGIIKSLGNDSIKVQLETGEVEEVEPYTWDIFNYQFDPQKKSLTTETVGKFTQLPIRLAWALTIHKSQGKTFDHVIMDLDQGVFATGQLYVALSRCRRFEGLYLSKPVKRGHAMVDTQIIQFMTGHQYRISEKAMPLTQKMKFLEEAILAKKEIQMTYLKNVDEKSRRVIIPLLVGEMEYAGKKFPGLKAYCHNRREERTFRVDRILELNNIVNDYQIPSS